MKIALGADHRGAELIEQLKTHLKSAGHTLHDEGVCRLESCDYPDSAFVVGRAVASGEVDRGLLVCGSGIGISIAANKVHGVRAALIHDERGAEMSRRHNDANILCLSGDTTSVETACRILDIWLRTEFEGGRHARRVEKVHIIERGANPSECDLSTC